MSETCAVQPFRSTNFEDEIAALALQLEEIGIYSQAGKGKHALGHPPDSDVTYANFQSELQAYQTFLRDQNFGRSIGAAVHSDGAAVAELTSEETQRHEDRPLALQTCRTDPQYQNPPRSISKETDSQIQDWIRTVAESRYAGSVYDPSEGETEAGPSMTFAQRQAEVL
ncbi:hypothetical protein GQ44DRAFT_623539 [Phaeosphaeriaceae sp. PMI808]|nr:hypothetical protein GQ44DRAFT_623539 [Phaeosphaeriaceae sp. PMI808]